MKSNNRSTPVHFQSLEGQFLLATPQHQGAFFDHAVIYICAHNPQGAMGLVVNHVLDHVQCAEILQQVGIDSSLIMHSPLVHLGGPVETGKGFILHTGEYLRNETVPVHNGLGLTSNIEMLRDLVSGKGPQKSLMTLGYAGWSPGQLESEIMKDNWIVAPADEEIIFEVAPQVKWEAALAKVGINSVNYSFVSGHA